MDRNSLRKPLSLFFLVVAAFLFLGAARLIPTSESPETVIVNGGIDKNVKVVELKDFTKQEVRAAGITLARDLTVHISAVGGGDRSLWQDAFADNESQRMFASGWIIDAKTRELIWDMTMENTSGRSDRRTCEQDIVLKKGSYEVYFQAYGYASGGTFSHFSMNIDRREHHRSSSRILNGILNLVGADQEDRYQDFMEYAKDRWGITLTVPEQDASFVQEFEAPMKTPNVVLAATNLGDNAVVRKSLEVRKNVHIHIYAIGEGTKGDGVDDYGWLVNADTRERVWDMNTKNVEYAGGGSKNIKYDGDISLTQGGYELYFITDGSHSADDWNARPPFDPLRYGVTVTVGTPGDGDAIRVSDARDEDKNVIVQLTEARNDDYKSAGFTLKKDTQVRIYALGESENDDRDMADYGWIVNARTHEHVWTMERSETFHAGGASKNRMADEVITLPKGSYVAYYQTDGSHAFDDWNSDPPFDPEHWGITIMGIGKTFDKSDVAAFSESNEEGVLAQIVRVRNDEHERRHFSIPSRTAIRIYAIGEADGDEMADYGWIENAETGQRVWEMEYDKTSWAGGAKKNRLFDKTITLDKGDYEVHFKTDGSHAFNDWNDDPPEDRGHWGITIYGDRR